jgi:hypothetical protein
LLKEGGASAALRLDLYLLSNTSSSTRVRYGMARRKQIFQGPSIPYVFPSEYFPLGLGANGACAPRDVDSAVCSCRLEVTSCGARRWRSPFTPISQWIRASGFRRGQGGVPVGRCALKRLEPFPALAILKEPAPPAALSRVPELSHPTLSPTQSQLRGVLQ